MIPIKTDVQIKTPPYLTIIFCLVCTVIYCLQSPVLFPGGVVPLDFVYSLLHPGGHLVTSGIILMSSFFLHGSLMHLIGNMWYLWLFGSKLEGTIGHFRFLLLYFASGIIAMLTQIANDPLSTIPIIGASGAIAGCMGMYLVVLPFSKVILGIPPLFSVRLYAGFFLLFWFWLQWASVGSTHPSSGRIAWWAHIGGFCFGAISGLYFRFFLSPRKNYHTKRKKGLRRK